MNYIINDQAEKLNKILKLDYPAAYSLLSERGKGIFFPKKGLIKQSAEARGKELNATIGISIDDDGQPMRLSAIESMLNIKPADAFPYAPSSGIPELREKWQQLIFKKNPSLSGQTISKPLVTSGLTHGLTITSFLFINPGDKIILTDIFWGNYKLIFEQAYQGRIESYPIFSQGGYNVAGLDQRLKEQQGKQIILLNFPHNPTGYTITDEEAGRIAEVIKNSAERGNKILIICDDAYFGLIYKKNILRESIFSRIAGLHENILAVKIDGATKEDFAWGFRVGFITFSGKNISKNACAALEEKASGAIRSTISNSSRLSQSLLLTALNSGNYDNEKSNKKDILNHRYMKVCSILDENKKMYSRYFSPLPFNSGYFLCIELKEGIDAEKLRQKLLNDFDTGVIALGSLIRIAFSSVPEDKIAKIFDNIYTACLQLAR
ncbi:aminotransferase class I/II-fold pyridoxal phosphate-dependent enzyme [bacterium]|nr:aminotransferase class I/II-fold pyridoxal phosphate-dependent enzyme [bacterium]